MATQRPSRRVLEERGRHGTYRCNHPLAVLVDPTEAELRELERMLAQCPHCSRWAPGDGPIMAIVVSRDDARQEPEEIR
jgi:hypothetical protein